MPDVPTVRLALYPALWLFAAVEGVEPTNNHAKRILRLGMPWRKNAFGCQSAAGCRFVEQMLTVAQTVRLPTDDTELILLQFVTTTHRSRCHNQQSA